MEIKLEPMIQAAKEGGMIVKKYFGEILEIEEKSHASDYRTAADTESEAAILEVLEKSFPNVSILSEEIGEIDKASNYTFVIDPLDGSNNFLIGIAHFSVSIALMKGDTIEAAVVYHPLLDDVYSAKKGDGAFLNGKPIHVSEESSLKNATVFYAKGYLEDELRKLRVLTELTKRNVKRFANNWGPAYDFCLIASGKVEAMISDNCEVYDNAAGKLIALEAGAKITSWDGQDIPETETVFIISNGSQLHNELIDIAIQCR
jgi:myo-inositol-1(or 4)-monophosphatase